MKPVTKAVIELGGVWPKVKNVHEGTFQGVVYTEKDNQFEVSYSEFNKEVNRLWCLYQSTSHPCRNFEEWLNRLYKEPPNQPATTNWKTAPTWATQIIEDDHGFYFWHDGAGKYQLIFDDNEGHANGIKTKRVVETRPLSRDLIKSGLQYHAKLARSQGREGDAMLFEAAAGEVGNG